MVIEQKNYSFQPQPKRRLVIFIDCCGGKKDLFISRLFYLHSIGNNKANEREVEKIGKVTKAGICFIPHGGSKGSQMVSFGPT